MNITPINYSANQNRNTQKTFGMKFTPDTMEIINEAALSKQVKGMVKKLLRNKDPFTSKIIKQGDEYILGLQHAEYANAREIFHTCSDGAKEYEKRGGLQEHPRVRLFEQTPSKIYSEETQNSLETTQVYKEIKYTLENIIAGIYNRMFNGDKFEVFTNKTLKPSHLENSKIMKEAKQYYQDTVQLIQDGKESGKIDEKAAEALNKKLDSLYDNGNIHPAIWTGTTCPGTGGPLYAPYKNNLQGRGYKKNIENMVKNNFDPPLKFTVREAGPKGNRYPQLGIINTNNPSIKVFFDSISPWENPFVGVMHFPSEYRKLLDSSTIIKSIKES